MTEARVAGCFGRAEDRGLSGAHGQDQDGLRYKHLSSSWLEKGASSGARVHGHSSSDVPFRGVDHRGVLKAI